jgi:ATP synthase protein I
MQWSAVVGLAAVAWLLGGAVAGGSALGGGIAVALPNTVLAAWLVLRMNTANAGAALAMMIAEGLKLVGTIGLMVVLVVLLGKRLVWPAMLSGIVVALVAQWFALLVTRRY